MRKIYISSACLILACIVGLSTSASNVFADDTSWTSGTPTYTVDEDQSKPHATLGCTNQNVRLGNDTQDTEVCIFYKDDYRFGQYYNYASSVREYAYASGNDSKMYRIRNIPIYMIPAASPDLDTIIYKDPSWNFHIIKDLPSKLTPILGSDNAIEYDYANAAPDFTLKRPSGSSIFTATVNTSYNGEWIVASSPDIGTMRINVDTYETKRISNYSSWDGSAGITNDGSHVVITHGGNYRPIPIYDVSSTCGDSITDSMTTSTPYINACAEADIQSYLYNNGIPTIKWGMDFRFSDDGGLLNFRIADETVWHQWITVKAPNYTPPSDADGDQLNAVQEASQSTSDTDADSDDDGLNDFIESTWNLSRNVTFCGAECAYPDPIKKDLYVEIDWMKSGGLFSRSFQPTATQLNLVKSTYEDKNIVFHADTGQYGGGNQLPIFSGSLIFTPTENELDFYDQKNGTSTVSANFNPGRRNIWRYMITGYDYMKTENEAGTTGSSYAGDDDSIVSIQRIEDLNPSNLDTAVAGSILHELGHNLCLTQESSIHYPDQPSDCIYGEIDKPLGQNPSSSYESVMNYLFQLSKTEYSTGSNGTPVDHDDWHAISLGMDDFQNSMFEWDDTQNQRQNFRGGDASSLRQSMIDNVQ